MSKALAWIRKSKGDDDDIGLQKQREDVKKLADELAEERDTLDLGVHTGFSSMTREKDYEQLLDENERVTTTLEKIREGVYEYLVAYDDTRICRDDYFSIIKYACKEGNCEIVYVADVETDNLTFDIKRRIERDTKEAEIRKSKEAIDRKKELGHELGRPRFGMTYNDAKTRQVPGEDFGKVEEILRLRESGVGYEAIADGVGVAVGTAHNVVDRRDWYRERAETEEAA